MHDYAYLLGLYLADGSLSSKGNSIAFCLQGNEGDIVDRVVSILRHMSINPTVNVEKDRRNMIRVNGCASNLFSFFPRKKVVLDGNVDEFLFFLKERKLLEVGDRLIAFLAGLLDGDGSCYVTLRNNKEGRYVFSHGSVETHWTFTAVSYPILALYVLFAIRSLLGGSASLSVVNHKDGNMHVVRVLNDGIVRLLNHGFYEHCWKARVWAERYSGLREIQMRSRHHSLKDVAKLLEVSLGFCAKLFKLGLLGGTCHIYSKSNVLKKTRYFFSDEEYDQLRGRREEILGRYYGDYRSLREVCRELHLCPDTGMKLFDAGVIKGDRKVYPSGQVRYSIPRHEAVSLLTKVKGRAKRVY